MNLLTKNRSKPKEQTRRSKDQPGKHKGTVQPKKHTTQDNNKSKGEFHLEPLRFDIITVRPHRFIYYNHTP